MPSDSNLNNLPPSPIDNEDLWLINREDKSYKVKSSQLGSYIVQLPIPDKCDATSDCPSGYVCVDGFCQRQPCDGVTPCPDNHYCYEGYCYPECTGDTCGEGYICVDPGTTGGKSICLPYPILSNPDLPTSDGCPTGYYGYNGYCWKTCTGGNCPDGMDCGTLPDNTNVCVYPDGGFPCAEGACPDGFQCYNGYCYPKCTDGTDCSTGYSCLDIGGGNSICYPDDGGKEKFVNDGPLVFRGKDASGNVTEKIVFTANQFGRSVVDLTGFDISGGSGGGSGGEISIKSLWTDDETDYKPTRADRSILPNGSGSLGGSAVDDRWDNVYTNDLHLSNEGKSNNVDGTWGDWTIQEGEDELFLLNNRNGKKYSFVLKEVIN